MIPVPTGMRMWLATGHCDMRKGHASSSVLAQDTLKRDPHGGQLFVFRGPIHELADEALGDLLSRSTTLKEKQWESISRSASQRLMSSDQKASPQKKKMKIVYALMSLMFAASLAGQGTAAPLRNKKQAHRQPTMAKPPRRTQQGGGDYHEQILDKVPFGSLRWWNVYEAQHGGRG